VVRECRDTAVPSLMALLSPDPTEWTQPRSENVTWKIPETNNSWLLNNFITAYCYNYSIALVVAVNLFLCIIYKLNFIGKNGQAWWCTPIIPAVRRQRQEDQAFKASLGYIVRSCLKKQTKVQNLVLYTEFGTI
jgi:hypothetical protein